MRDLIFVHNPKAASTSIRKVLDVRTPKIGKRSPHRHIHIPLRSKFYEKQIRQAQEPWVFAVVRHPLDRFVSAWAYFQRPRKRTVKENYVLEAMLQGGDIDDFVRCCDFEKISKHIPHFQPQWWILEAGKSGHNVDQILHFETLDDDFKELCSIAGVAYEKLPRLRSTKHKKFQQLLSDESIQKMQDYYSKDYETYGYQRI